MPKAVGIDLGTTNSVVAVLEAGEPVVIPNAEGVPHHPVGRRVLQDRRGARRRGRQAPGDHQPRSHDPLGQAPHGHQLVDRHRRQGVHARRRSRARIAAEAEARRRGLPRRHRHPGRHHRARVLRRRPAHRPPRRPARSPASRCCASSTSPPRPRWPTGSTRRAPTRRSSCSTSAAARSTCRSSRSATACSRSSRPPATPTSAATTGTSGSSTGWSSEFKNAHGVDLATDKMAVAAPQGGGREGQDRAVAGAGDARSTCRSSPPRPTARCTSTSTLTRAKFQELTADLLERCRGPFEQAIKDAGLDQGRDRPRDPRRRLHPHARGAGAGAASSPARTPHKGVNPDEVVAVGAADPGRRAQGRGQGRPAPRRHAAVARHRDQGRRHDQAHRAQHHHPHQAAPRCSPPPRTISRRVEIHVLQGEREMATVQQDARQVPARRPARRRRVACRRSRSPSTSTPTASCTCPPRTGPRARSSR